MSPRFRSCHLSFNQPVTQTEGESNPLKFSQVFHLAPAGGSFVVTNGRLSCLLCLEQRGSISVVFDCSGHHACGPGDWPDQEKHVLTRNNSLERIFSLSLCRYLPAQLRLGDVNALLVLSCAGRMCCLLRCVACSAPRGLVSDPFEWAVLANVFTGESHQSPRNRLMNYSETTPHTT